MAETEVAELAIIESYLPQQLSEEEVDQLIAEAKSQTGASSPKEMGKVMGILRDKTLGRVDGKLLAEKVRAALS